MSSSALSRTFDLSLRLSKRSRNEDDEEFKGQWKIPFRATGPWYLSTVNPAMENDRGRPNWYPQHHCVCVGGGAL